MPEPKISTLKDVLGRSLELPCGVILKNRLAKSAMSDSLGDGKGDPTKAQMRLYERWAEGGVALSLIGEVQGDPRYPEKPGNLVLVPDANQKAMQELARRGSVNGAFFGHSLVMQVHCRTSPSVSPRGHPRWILKVFNARACQRKTFRKFLAFMQALQS